MHPRDYPWAVPARTGVVLPDGLTPRRLPSLDGRTPVVAVGSNASPQVLLGKLGALLTTGLPVAPAVVTDVITGHSAHVSTRGYVAAAPALAPGARSDLAVGWFDEAQLARLDETEPNYRRTTLLSSCRLDDGSAVTGAQIYVSVHGLLANEGEVLPFRPQVEVLGWLAERLPDLAADLTHERLADPEVRERLRTSLIAARLRADPWLGGARGHDTGGAPIGGSVGAPCGTRRRRWPRRELKSGQRAAEPSV